MKYFAHGSNMNHKQMVERCPEAKFVKRGYLENYCLVYDGWSVIRKCAVTNILYSKGDMVWGGLYEINQNDLAALDKREGYPDRYDKGEFEIRDDKGKPVKAIIYFRIGQKEGKPSEEYRDTVIQGAHDCGLPEDYISFLAGETIEA